MKKFKKTCARCTSPFEATGPAGKYCPDCSIIHKRESNRKKSYAYKLRNNMIEKPGVGSGGNQVGKDNHRYKTGLNGFKTEALRRKEAGALCNRCSKPLKDLGPFEWVGHHIDHDRTNNDFSNLELLCKKCHQLHHDCINNLPNKDKNELS